MVSGDASEWLLMHTRGLIPRRKRIECSGREDTTCTARIAWKRQSMNDQLKGRHSTSGVNLQVIGLDLYHVYTQHVYSICMTYVECVYCLVLCIYIHTHIVSPSKVRVIATLAGIASVINHTDPKILRWWTVHTQSAIAVIS